MSSEVEMTSNSKNASTTAVSKEKDLEEAEINTSNATEKIDSDDVNNNKAQQQQQEQQQQIEAQKNQQPQQKDNKNKKEQSRSFLFVDIMKDWIATILIGFLVVSYWRGTWTLLDIWTCNQGPMASMVDGNSLCYASNFRNPIRYKSGILTYWISIIVLIIGISFMWIGGLWNIRSTPTKIAIAKKSDNDESDENDKEMKAKALVTPQKAAMRFCIIYILGCGTVLNWHGLWYLIDYYFIPHDMLQSFWYGTLVGFFFVYLLYCANSVLAPPAICLFDGPSYNNPPPIAVTITTSYYSLILPYNKKPPPLSVVMKIIDIVLSFIIIPFGVVLFWSSIWQLMDYYLYGYTPYIVDVYISIGYSAIIACVTLIMASDDIFCFIRIDNEYINMLLGRLRTLVLAIGTVNFWRCIWLLWDEYIFGGGTSLLSALLSHIIGIVGLTTLGCLSSITAPPSTLGVDAIPHVDAADEPLFCGIPVEAESLYIFAIARQPLHHHHHEEEEEEEEEEENRLTNMISTADAVAVEGGEDNDEEMVSQSFFNSLRQFVGSSSLRQYESFYTIQRPGQRFCRKMDIGGEAITTTSSSTLSVPISKAFTFRSQRNQSKREKNTFFRNR